MENFSYLKCRGQSGKAGYLCKGSQEVGTSQKAAPSFVAAPVQAGREYKLTSDLFREKRVNLVNCCLRDGGIVILCNCCYKISLLGSDIYLAQPANNLASVFTVNSSK